MTTFVDFDELIYLQFEHSPGHAQWWVMLNLGAALTSDKKSAVILERFSHKEDAANYKRQILAGCTKGKVERCLPSCK